MNRQLAFNEAKYYTSHVRNIVSYIKGRYQTYPPAEWTLQKEMEIGTGTCTGTSTQDVVSPSHVHAAIHMLKKWYMENDVNVAIYCDSNDITLDMVRNVKLMP
jgi:hypothetical protein